jgi:putative tricarboxylic transport membrane protein
MIKHDAPVAVLAIGLGAAAAYEAAKLPFGTIHNPGPGFFPWWTSVVIILLGLVLVFTALRPRSSHARKDSGRVVKVFVLLVVLAVYTFLLDLLGYLVCTFLLVLFMLRATDPQRWPIALCVAAMAAIGSYVVFAVWLSVPLPRGPL